METPSEDFTQTVHRDEDFMGMARVYIKCDSAAALKRLLDAGTLDVNQRDPYEGKTLIHLAVEEQKVAVIRRPTSPVRLAEGTLLEGVGVQIW